jgi:endonuclease YncB( thermonuclease family)
MSLEEKKLENVTSKDIDRFTMAGMKGPVKVVSVFDGDTCDVVFELYGQYKQRLRCRMLDYDAPEREKGKTDWKLARDYLAHLVKGGDPGHDSSFFDSKNIWTKEQLQNNLDESKRVVYAEFGIFDKFGRVLARLKRNPADERWINSMMKEFIEELKEKQKK